MKFYVKSLKFIPCFFFSLKTHLITVSVATVTNIHCRAGSEANELTALNICTSESECDYTTHISCAHVMNINLRNATKALWMRPPLPMGPSVCLYTYASSSKYYHSYIYRHYIFCICRTRAPVTTLSTMTATRHLILTLTSPTHTAQSVRGKWGWPRTVSVELE